jgi:glyoxylase-like metal-dependent hydrolase (beta-lactamase superfamily II)
MNTVKVLIDGYAHPNGDGSYTASPTTTLVESNGIKFLVDPGTSKDKLLAALKKENITENDLAFIYLSHYHIDHLLNIRLFPTLDVYDGEVCWSGDREIPHHGKLPGVDVEILKTSGHSSESTSLLVDTPEGKVCICADVFWWEDGKQPAYTYEGYINTEDPYVENEQLLINSRILVLQRSDLIIPGHGRMFRVYKKL